MIEFTNITLLLSFSEGYFLCRVVGKSLILIDIRLMPFPIAIVGFGLVLMSIVAENTASAQW